MKVNGNYVSVKFILNRILVEQPFIERINLGDVVEWTGEFIKYLGVNDLYETYTCEVDITDYRGVLPPNYQSINAIREKSEKLGLKETINKFPKGLNPNTDYQNYADFSIKDKCIFVDFETGTLEISFEGFILDEDGFPKIPDEERIIQGVYWYIVHKIAYGMWMVGKLPNDKFAYIDQKKAFHMASSRYYGKMPSKQKMESIKDQQLRLVPDTNAYKDSFVTLNNIEEIKIRP